MTTALEPSPFAHTGAGGHQREAAGALVRFHVYGWRELAVPAAAGRVVATLALPLTRRQGAARGVYYRWSGRDGCDLLLQSDIAQDHPGHATLLYATSLADELYDRLARLPGLDLLDARALFVPPPPVTVRGERHLSTVREP